MTSTKFRNAYWAVKEDFFSVFQLLINWKCKQLLGLTPISERSGLRLSIPCVAQQHGRNDAVLTHYRAASSSEQALQHVLKELSLPHYVSSEWPPFVEAEVRQQFQPHKINITGIPVNKIIHSTFKTHWQLWHMGKQHNTEKAQTRSDWHIWQWGLLSPTST